MLTALIFSTLTLFLLIRHSRRTRGDSLTWNFFLFTLFLTFSKGAKTGLGQAGLNITSAYKPVFLSLSGAMLVLILFYTSWCLAEAITRKSRLLKDEISATVIAAGAVCLIMAYAIGFRFSWVSHGNIGLAKFFIGYPFSTAQEWSYCLIHFLTAFLLINCSRYKNREWKALLFLIPLIHTWLGRFFNDPLMQFTEEYIFAGSLLILTALKVAGSGMPGLSRSKKMQP